MKYIFILLTLTFSFQLFSQYPNWKNYTYKDQVNVLYETSNKMYVGSSGGVMVRDLNGNVLNEYTKAEGLASNIVFGITSDSNGNMWFATDKGVSKFDGISWTTYNESNSGLTDELVYSIASDSQDNIWIGTSFDGVFQFDGTNWTNYNTSNSGLASNNILGLLADSQNRIWLATGYGGVSMFDGTNWSTYTTSNSGIVSDVVNRICKDSNDNIWIGTPDGAGKFDGISWTTFNYGNSGLYSNFVTFIGADSANNIWIGGIQQISKFDGTNWSVLSCPNVMQTFALDNQGTCWFGATGGIYTYDGADWTTYVSGGVTLPSNNIYSLEADGNNNIWIGYEGNGVSKFNETEWLTYHSNFNQLDYVHSIYNDAQGNMWFGGSGNLTKYDGTNWTTLNSSNSNIPAFDISVLKGGPAGTFWVGTLGGGAIKYDGSLFTNYTVANSGLPSDFISGIGKDTQGQIWFSTYSGVAKYNGTDWMVFDVDNSDVSSNYLNAISIDMNDVAWFGSYPDDLDRFDGTTWGHYNNTNSPFSGYVQCLFTDNQNILWIGTNSGLVKFDGTDWVRFTSNNSPLQTDDIRVLNGDLNGNLWIGVEGGGVYKYSSNQTVSLNENSPGIIEMKIYPNPFSEITTIDFENQGNIAELKVYDLSGKCLLHDKTRGDQFIVRKDQLGTAGLYLVSVKTESGSVSGKIIID